MPSIYLHITTRLTPFIYYLLHSHTIHTQIQTSQRQEWKKQADSGINDDVSWAQLGLGRTRPDQTRPETRQPTAHALCLEHHDRHDKAGHIEAGSGRQKLSVIASNRLTEIVENVLTLYRSLQTRWRSLQPTCRSLDVMYFKQCICYHSFTTMLLSSLHRHATPSHQIPLKSPLVLSCLAIASPRLASHNITSHHIASRSQPPPTIHKDQKENTTRRKRQQDHYVKTHRPNKQQ